MAVTATIDSNVLIYAALEPGSAKGRRAAQTIRLSPARTVLAVQALLEFTTVVRRRAPSLGDVAVAQVDAWAQTYQLAATTPSVMQAALSMVQRHRFQVWDAVIWAAARAGGASLFLSEDLQDGLYLDGMTVVNPFIRSEAELSALLD